VDSTTARAHVHAAGARRDSSDRIDGEPADHALGRSRGGWSTKIHLACEGHLHALAFVLTPGQAGDSPQLIPVLERIRVPRVGTGRPRTRPDRVLGDKAYSSRANRRLPGPPQDQGHHPDPGRPDRPPQRPRVSRRPTTGLRPGRLPRPARRRVRHQRPQAQTIHRHPLRQARRPLRRHHPHRQHRPLAQTTFVTGPRHGPGRTGGGSASRRHAVRTPRSAYPTSCHAELRTSARAGVRASAAAVHERRSVLEEAARAITACSVSGAERRISLEKPDQAVLPYSGGLTLTHRQPCTLSSCP